MVTVFQVGRYFDFHFIVKVRIPFQIKKVFCQHRLESKSPLLLLTLPLKTAFVSQIFNLYQRKPFDIH